mmetsp:Transcript_6833/g.12180  ORF Transcript_6833/g.12180 Transcript_6833/m.12180 type:complete len:89 (+) Transcript_6833:145-411(+)
MDTIMAAFGESLALAEFVGLNGDKMLEVIGQGAIQSPMYALKLPTMLKKDFAPNFPMQHSHKDMKLAVGMAKEAGVEYALTECAGQGR